MNRTPCFKLAAHAAALAAAALTACMDGDDAPPAPAAPVTISGVVADGPLSGATACYDLNDNAACDSAEPSATTDTNGRYSFEVAAAAAGAHAVVVDVPATAIDRTTGQPIGVAYTLRAPASGNSGTQTVFVSPLTTLVADLVANEGLTLADAAARIQAQLELAASPLADFVASGDAQATKLAATLVALRVEAAQLAAAAQLPDAVAQPLIDAAATADLAALVGVVGANPGATPEALAEALLVERGLTPDTIAEHAEIEAAFANPLPAADAGPFASVRRFTWTDADNHQLQVFIGDSSQTDATGAFLASEARVNRTAGASLPFNRNTAYWNRKTGAWEVCAREWQIVRTTPPSAATANRQVSFYCGASESRTRIGEVDIAGQTMASVIEKVRASSRADAPGFDTDSGGLPTKWGPAPAAVGAAVFPDGSRLSYREQVSEVGDTERYSLTDKPRVVPAGGVGSGTFRHAPTFTELKRMSANWVDPNVTVTNLNTVFLEDLPNANPGAGMSPVRRYRAGFNPANDQVRFFACDVLAADNSSLNCEALGDGQSAITAQGDGRVLRYTSGYPAALRMALKRQRLLVERDGVVFGGWRDLETLRFSQRLNTTAWNALRTALGMAEPAAPQAPVTDPLAFQLARFSYTDANNLSFRTFRGEAPAADGTQVLIEQQEFLVNGVTQPWLRNALYWTGSTWYACPDDPSAGGNFVAVGTFNDRTGTTDYCQSYKDSERRRSVVTLDGRSVQDVLRDIRWYPTKDGSYDYAGFGPNPDTTPAFVGATFPAGATLTYQSSKRDATPIVLFTRDTDRLRLAPAADTTAPFANWPLAATLDEVIAKNPGDFYPITAFNGQLTGNITQGVTSWFLAAPSDPLYTSEVGVRVAFDAVGRKARFYMHNRLASNNNSVNYVKLLDTTYSIETAGDAQVLRFAALPPEVSERLAGERTYIARGGEVRYGAKDAIPAGRRMSLRLNDTAAEFLGNLLGLN